MTAFIPLAALLLLLAWLTVRRRPHRNTLARQRQIARRAHLDTYTPQSQDRFWGDWESHRQGGAQ